MSKQYKLVVYVPESHLELLKSALFAAGAGRQGCYDRCCWQTPGTGQFRPLEGSQPFIGEAAKAQGVVEQVAEYRVEMLCAEAVLKTVLTALVDTHPYEEPAFDVFERLENVD